MRKNPVPDEVVGALDFNVPNPFQTHGLDRDDGVPEDGRGGSSIGRFLEQPPYPPNGKCAIIWIVMKPLDKGRQEFIAKFLADLDKAIFAVGLASYFFQNFPAWLRVTLCVMFVVLAVLSVVIHPRKEGD